MLDGFLRAFSCLQRSSLHIYIWNGERVCKRQPGCHQSVQSTPLRRKTLPPFQCMFRIRGFETESRHRETSWISTPKQLAVVNVLIPQWHGMFDCLTLKILLIMKHHLCRLVAVDPQAILEMWTPSFGWWNHLKSVPAAQYPNCHHHWGKSMACERVMSRPTSAMSRPTSAVQRPPGNRPQSARLGPRSHAGSGPEDEKMDGPEFQKKPRVTEEKLDVFFWGWIYVINVTINRMLRAHTHYD